MSTSDNPLNIQAERNRVLQTMAVGAAHDKDPRETRNRSRDNPPGKKPTDVPDRRHKYPGLLRRYQIYLALDTEGCFCRILTIFDKQGKVTSNALWKYTIWPAA